MWEEKRHLREAKLAQAKADDARLLGSFSGKMLISVHARRPLLSEAEHKQLQRSVNAVARLEEQLAAHLRAEPQSTEPLLFSPD